MVVLLVVGGGAMLPQGGGGMTTRSGKIEFKIRLGFGLRKGLFCQCDTRKWDKKYLIFKNEPENLLILNRNDRETNRNEPKNEAEKLLKTLKRVKNEPKTNRAMLLKIKDR